MHLLICSWVSVGAWSDLLLASRKTGRQTDRLTDDSIINVFFVI